MSFSLRRAYRRHQTLILATLTFAVFLWAAIDVFDVEVLVIKQFLFATLALVSGVILCAAATVLLLLLIKRWLKR